MWVVEGRGRAQAGPALLWVSQITMSRLCHGSPRVPVSLQPPLPASCFMAVPQGWQSPQLPSLSAASAFNLWHPWPCNAVQQVFHGAGVEPSWQLQASRGFPAGGPGGWHRGWHGGTGDGTGECAGSSAATLMSCSRATWPGDPQGWLGWLFPVFHAGKLQAQQCPRGCRCRSEMWFCSQLVSSCPSTTGNVATVYG